MPAILHSTTSGGGSFLRFSGDHQTPRRNLSFRTWATAQGSAASQTAACPPTLYQLLGISDSDGLEEVKKAYKKMAMKYHPDVSPPDRTQDHTRRFIEVQEAYETLSDPQRRADYDKRIRNGFTRLAFNARNGHFDQEMEVKSEWRNRWQDQISELKRRSHVKTNNINNVNNNINNISDENLSWGARMRRKREQTSE